LPQKSFKILEQGCNLMDPVEVFKLFPVPIFSIKLNNYNEINAKLKNYIEELRNNNPSGVKLSNIGGWHSPNFDIKKNFVIKSFVANVKVVLNGIFHNQMGWDFQDEQIDISNMWSVINKKNSLNVRHNHPNSHFSAAYYVKIPENSGQIKFFDPKEVNAMYYPKKRVYNEFNSAIAKIRPEEGKLLLFPSYLHHGVDENLSEEERIVISFNVIVR